MFSLFPEKEVKIVFNSTTHPYPHIKMSGMCKENTNLQEKKEVDILEINIMTDSKQKEIKPPETPPPLQNRHPN